MYGVEYDCRALIGGFQEVVVNTTADVVVVEFSSRNYTARRIGGLFKAFIPLRGVPEGKHTLKVYCMRGGEVEVRELEFTAYDIPSIKLKLSSRRLVLKHVVVEKYRRFRVREVCPEEIEVEAVVEDSSPILGVKLLYNRHTVEMAKLPSGSYWCSLPASVAEVGDESIELKAVAEDAFHNIGLAGARVEVEVEALVIEGVPLHRQPPGKPWCLPACIQMLLDYYGCTPLPSQEEIAEVLGEMIVAPSLIRYLRTLGFTIVGYEYWRPEERLHRAIEFLTQGYPIIVSVTIPGWQAGHALVLYGYNSSKQVFYALNPWGRREELPYTEYKLRGRPMMYLVKPLGLGGILYKASAPGSSSMCCPSLSLMAPLREEPTRWFRCIGL
ncbi:MAG: hypothetical protein DRN96_08980 [Thermoproteota archaeon]|nr:MAG: hypothetical protein DRN96_08980 [Candidatus Korarchaeota archaeon]